MEYLRTKPTNEVNLNISLLIDIYRIMQDRNRKKRGV